MGAAEGREGTPDARSATRYLVERGPLERRTRISSLRLAWASNMARDLEDLGLSVTSESDRSDTEPGIWTQITQAVVEAFGAEQVELACAATVFAATTADRLVEVRAAAPCCGFSQSMPTAPTRFGRVVDTVATWPLLRWVPGLR